LKFNEPFKGDDRITLGGVVSFGPPVGPLP